MSDVFGSDFFSGNRERLRQLFTGTAPIVITANGLLQKTSDEAYEFHQDSNLWYLTGINDPDVVLVMDKSREYLILPERTTWMDVSEGEIKPDELTRRSGIAEVLKQKEGWRQLSARLKRVQHVATLSANPPYMDVFGMYANPARAALIKRLKEANDNLELLDLRQHLRRMRMIKQPAELEALRRALEETVETLKHVTRPSNLAKYAYDVELEADISHQFRRRGAQGHAFSPVVISGPRACTLHSKADNVLLASDELVVLDVGAKADYYCADITRTITLNGKPSRRQQAVHKAVEQAQDYAYSLIKPGLSLAEYEKAMAHFVGEKLRELGVIKSIDTEQVRKYFPHATSHFLGLDAHDAGDYDHPLEPGVVMTVEPGIYIPEEGIGVRIEDDLLITEDGYEILSKDLPRELQ
jgi:Xaa-Pro aminopeptidase